MKEIVDEIKALKSEVDSKIEAKASEVADAKVKKATENLEAKLNEVQAHIDQVDVLVQDSVDLNSKSNEQKSFNVIIKDIVNENFEQISKVRKGRAFSTKAVGNMTLGNNLTGDQIRIYGDEVAIVPSPKLNVADLVGTINIDGGTYTFPRESGSEGAIGTQTEGNDKSQIDYDITMVDVNTDFIAGFAVYSKKMANNLPFLESFLPEALRRDYLKQENSTFFTTLSSGVTASTETITSKNKVEMLINDIAGLEQINFAPNGVVIRPSDFFDILKTEKSTGAGYGLPPYVSYENGQMRINGIPVYRATWVASNKYLVGDWSNVKRIVTEGLSVDFSDSDEDNFRKNNITARVEAQVGLAIERTDALRLGDFTNT